MYSLCRALSHCSMRTRPHSLPSFMIYYSTKQPYDLSPSLTPAALKEVAAECVSDSLKPTEIPFQPKVANSVNIIGAVQSPVQFLVSHDGKYWAGTIISQESPSSLPLSIPVIFEGDLAHTAACHLKENDDIYVAGHLSADKMPLTLTSNQENLQVVARSLNFVQGSPSVKRQFTSHKVEKKPNNSVSAKIALDSSSWEDLFNNPTEWKDFRNDKRRRVVKLKHPDFKHRQDGRSLWLNKAPRWSLKKLEGSEIKSGSRGSAASRVESWKNLIENPSKWWDNRCTKRTSRQPDFRHKDGGEGLWLDGAPDWALPKLPPQEPKAH